jgi:hypothetical protein
MRRTDKSEVMPALPWWPGLRDSLASMIASRRLSVVVPVTYMALLLMGASVSVDENQEERHLLWFLAIMPMVFQNLLHIPAYGLLAFFWRWSLDRYMAARAAIYVAFILTVGFGVYQEWHQSLILGRYASLLDVLFDAIGAGIGLWLYCTLRVKRDL